MHIGGRWPAAFLAFFFFGLTFLSFTHVYRTAGPPYRDDFNISNSKDGTNEGRDLWETEESAKAMMTGGVSHVPYPPLAIAAHIALTVFNFERSYRIFAAFLLVGLFLAVYFSLAESRRLKGFPLLVASVVVTTIFYHSYWFQFELERGNSNTFCATLSAIGLWFLSGGSAAAATISLVLASQWRIYPAILGFFLLSRAGVKTFARFIAFNLLALVLFGWEQLAHFVKIAAESPNMAWRPNHSLVLFLWYSPLGPYVHLVRILLAASGLAMFYVRWRVLDKTPLAVTATRTPFTISETALIGIAFQLMALLPAISIDYKLGIEIVPFLMIITRYAPESEVNPTLFYTAIALISVCVGSLSAPAPLVKTPALLVSLACYGAIALNSFFPRPADTRVRMSDESDDDTAPVPGAPRLMPVPEPAAPVVSHAENRPATVGETESPDLRDAGTERRTGWRYTVPFLTSVVLVGLMIRAYKIGGRGLWQDEIDLWLGALSNWRSSQMAPLPLWVHGAWLRLVGGYDVPLVLHIPNLFIGALLAVPMYFLGKHFFERRTGLLAAAFTAISPMAIYYSQEARPYVLFMNLICLTIFAFARARSEGTLKWTLAYIAAGTLAFLTHMLTGFVLAALVLWALIEDIWDRRPGRFIPVALASAVCGTGALWIFHRWHPVQSVASTLYPGSVWSFLRVAFYALGPEISQTGTWSIPITGAAILMIALAVMGVIRLKRERPGLLYALLPMIIVVCLAALFLTLGDKGSWKWERYATPMLPPFLVLVAGGCLDLRPLLRKGAIALTVLILFSGILSWADHETYNRSEEQAKMSAKLASNASTLNGFVMLAPSTLISRPIAVTAFRFSRTDGLPTYVMDGPLLYSVPMGSAIPDDSTWAATKVDGLPPGRYAFYDWANWAGNLQDKLAVNPALVTGVFQEAQSKTVGADVYLYASTATIKASRK